MNIRTQRIVARIAVTTMAAMAPFVLIQAPASADEDWSQLGSNPYVTTSSSNLQFYPAEGADTDRFTIDIDLDANIPSDCSHYDCRVHLNFWCFGQNGRFTSTTSVPSDSHRVGAFQYHYSPLPGTTIGGCGPEAAAHAYMMSVIQFGVDSDGHTTTTFWYSETHLIEYGDFPLASYRKALIESVGEDEDFEGRCANLSDKPDLEYMCAWGSHSHLNWPEGKVNLMVAWILQAGGTTDDLLALLEPPSSGHDDFVYVALGDSYQSGEGAGNSLSNTSLYLSTAYEDGENFTPDTGWPQNTYTPDLLTGGNGCHRALNNYAKINRDLLEPGASVTLVDVTCSGARIEPDGGKPPIVGTVGSGISLSGQTNQAILRLLDAGLDPADVDLVTVGMGGNDAEFGEIIKACVIPNFVRRLLDKYPDSPGELEFLAKMAASCAIYDRQFTKTDPAIEALQATEEWAQQQLLTVFPNARIQQVNYPDILPAGESAPAWCGGMRKEDLDFARSKLVRINEAIKASIDATGSPRLELVDIENAFGSNALCPGGTQAALAAGLSEANIDAELERLLNLDGDGDPMAREKLDTLVREYLDVRACVGNKLNPFDGDCDMGKEESEVTDAANDLMAYLGAKPMLTTIFANAIEQPGPDAEPDEVRWDRTRGIFHPNADGHAVIACNMRAAYEGISSASCLSSAEPPVSTVNGVAFGLQPILVDPDEGLTIQVGGYTPSSPIKVTLRSDEIDLGEFTTDSEGQVEFTIQVPDVSPGVHRLEMSGVGAGGVQVVNDLKIEIPGEPTPGGSYGVYLTGFGAGAPEDGVLEYVDVTYLGLSFIAIADDEGGVFLELPVPNNSGGVTVEAVSQLTGESVERTLVIDNPDDLTLDAWGRSFAAPPQWNSAKASRSLSITFRVLDGQGMPVNDPAVIDLRSYGLDCQSGTDLGDVEPATYPGKSDLRLQGNGWWRVNWKTDKEFAGSCRTFSVVIDNGGRHDLWFEFR